MLICKCCRGPVEFKTFCDSRFGMFDCYSGFYCYECGDITGLIIQSDLPGWRTLGRLGTERISDYDHT